nr:sigma-70 family RNA polymerase sigma factor [Fodinicola feengrottensis]
MSDVLSARSSSGSPHTKVSDAHRGASRDLSQPVEVLPDVIDSANDPEQAALAADRAARVHELLGNLSDIQREVVLLRVAVGLSAEEAGSVLGMSPGAVRVAQHRALNRLREMVQSSANEVSA